MLGAGRGVIVQYNTVPPDQNLDCSLSRSILLLSAKNLISPHYVKKNWFCSGFLFVCTYFLFILIANIMIHTCLDHLEL